MKVLIVFLSLIAVPFIHASTLVGTYGVDIVALDGVKTEGGLFRKNELTVSDGAHQVVVIYDKNFQNDQRVTSKPHIFQIDVKGYTEISVKHFNNAYLAKNEIKKGIIWIVKNTQNTQKFADSDSLSGEGFLPNKNIEKLIAAYNQAHGLSIFTSNPAILPTTTIISSSQSNDVKGQANAAQLIQMYNAASKEERKAFRIWLLEQDLK